MYFNSFLAFTFAPSFSIIHYFLPNRGRIFPALMEKNKIKNFPTGDQTQDLLILMPMLY